MKLRNLVKCDDRWDVTMPALDVQKMKYATQIFTRAFCALCVVDNQLISLFNWKINLHLCTCKQFF